jgi:hypothetical protein
MIEYRTTRLSSESGMRHRLPLIATPSASFGGMRRPS